MSWYQPPLMPRPLSASIAFLKILLMCDVRMYVLYVLVGVGVCSCVRGAHVCEYVETKSQCGGSVSSISLQLFLCVRDKALL